jgi:hypothetical protein
MATIYSSCFMSIACSLCCLIMTRGFIYVTNRRNTQRDEPMELCLILGYILKLVFVPYIKVSVKDHSDINPGFNHKAVHMGRRSSKFFGFFPAFIISTLFHTHLSPSLTCVRGLTQVITASILNRTLI